MLRDDTRFPMRLQCEQFKLTPLLERRYRQLGGAVRFVLASSGHIAGIINPPGGKGTYWVNESAEPAPTAAQWRATSTRHDGSWWSDWAAWLSERAGPLGEPPAMGSDAHPALEDAPGHYVLEK